MLLGKFLTGQLYQLTKDRSDVAGSLVWMEQAARPHYAWVMTHADWHVKLAFENHDRHSAELHGLYVGQCRVQSGAVAERLQQYADAAIARLNYLEEPLGIYEADAGERVVCLRSLPPQHAGDEVSYWQVNIWEDGAQAAELAPATPPMVRANIVRFCWQPGLIEQEVVAYPVTFSFLGRLADSLGAVLGG